jgi:hypothetical protein
MFEIKTIKAIRPGRTGFLAIPGEPPVGPPAFTAAPIIDNFDRANEGPPPSSNWTTGIDGGSVGFSVSSNQAAPAGEGASMFWNAADFGPDLDVYATRSVNNAPIRIYWRMVSAGTSGVDGYAALAYTDGNIYVYKVTNFGNTQIGAAMAQAVAAGGSLGVRMIGSTIDVYYKAPAGSWVLVGSRSDSTYSAAGKVGVQFFDGTSHRLDDFGAGTL